jgi:hypothetical protein
MNAGKNLRVGSGTAILWFSCMAISHAQVTYPDSRLSASPRIEVKDHGKESTTADDQGNAVSIDRMRQVYEEIKTPFKHGVVIRGETPNQFVDSPSIFRHENQWYMIYIAITDEIGYETFLASISDLLHWKKLGKILGFPQDGWDRWQRAGGVALCDPTSMGSEYTD